MKDFERKLLSTICAMSMAMSSAGSLSAWAADIDYSIGDITIGDIDLESGEAKSVDEIKAAIAAMGAITFDNCISKENEIISIVKAVNLLSDEDKALLNVEIDTESVSDTYWKIIKDAAYIREAYDVYCLIKDEVPEAGTKNANITKDNYKSYYGTIDNVGAEFDKLSSGAQKMLAQTAYLFKWENAQNSFDICYDNEISEFINFNLNKIVTDEVTADNYTKAVKTLSDTKAMYEGLLDDQKIEINEKIAPQDIASVISMGEAAIEAFETGSIEAVNALIADGITFENCTDAKANGEKALELYNVLIGLDQSKFADEALAVAIADYISAADYFIRAGAVKKEDFTSANYVSKKADIDNLIAAFEGLTDGAKVLAADAIEYVNATDSAWTEFKNDLVNKAIEAIDAIEDFDYETWKDREKWAAIDDAIKAATDAIKDVAEIHHEEIINKPEFDTVIDPLFKQINADYAVANEFIELVRKLGTVGDVATDSVVPTAEYGALIVAAEDKKEELNEQQLELVPDETAKLEAARAEYDNIVAAADSAKEAVEAYRAALEELSFDYEDYSDDEEGTVTREAVKAVTDLYDAAYALANDEAYGTKLSDILTQEDTKKKDDLISFSEKVIALRTSGRALVDAVKGLFDVFAAAGFEIDLDTEEDDILAILQEYLAETADEGAPIAAVSEFATAYKKAYEECKNIKTVPEAVAPYSEYATYQARYLLIAAALSDINPPEKQGAVDAWADAVAVLFNNIEDMCTEGTAAAEYDRLSDKEREFDAYQELYAASKHPDAYSQLIYVGLRVDQYKTANEFVNNVNKEQAELDRIDSIREADGDAVYKNKLNEFKNVFNGYKDILPAMVDITGVKDALEIADECIEIVENRRIAYRFDEDTKAFLDTFVLPTEGFKAVQEDKFAVLWVLGKTEDDNVDPKFVAYNSLTDIQKEYVWYADELAACEAELAKAAISAIERVNVNAESFTYAALKDVVEEAREVYDERYDFGDVEVANLNILEEYEGILPYASSVAAILEDINENNYSSYKSDIDELREACAEYKNKEFISKAESIRDKAEDQFYTLDAKPVSFMIAELPEPADIEAMTDINELDAVKEKLDAITASYAERAMESKLRVEGYARYTLGLNAYNKAINAYNTNVAAGVIALIDAIGYEKGCMTAQDYKQYEAAINAARAAYDSLNDDQKILVTNYLTLEDAEKEYSEWSLAEEEAIAVKVMIAELEADVTEDNYKAVREAWTLIDDAISNLSSNAREFITAEEFEKLNDVYAAVRFISEYMDVVGRINDELKNSGVYNAIINDSAIDLEYAVTISDIESDYNELSVDQKLEVSNYVILVEARNTYNRNIENAIATIQSSIDAIDMSRIAKNQATNTMLGEIEELVNSLSDENKAKIGSNAEDTEFATRLEKLEAARAKYNEMKTVDEVIDIIGALGNPSELNEDNYEEKKASVEEAKKAFNTLSDEDKMDVSNYSALEEWINAIDGFTIDRSGDLNLDGTVDIDDIYTMVQIALGKYTPTTEEFELANIVKEAGVEEETIDIYDILAAIDKIEF